MYKILAINPGATSTKVGVFEKALPVWKATLEHQGADHEKRAATFAERCRERREIILTALANANLTLDGLAAVAARGGLLKPLRGGTCVVNDLMVRDLEEAKRGVHASNLGAPIALGLARERGIPAFIVDPVSVDEMEPVARLSGFPELPRISMSHALNSKAVAKNVARQIGRRYEEVNLVVVHLGTGISVSPHRKGRMIDVNDACQEGPFAADRCGGLPALALAKLCFSGKYTEKELLARIVGSGGLFAYLGTRDLREAERRAGEGDSGALLTLHAMAYQVAKEIGAMATVLCGVVDRIVITGGMAHSQLIVEEISRRVRFIAPVVVVPGEEELESLALGALRVLTGEESAFTYE